MSNGMICGQCHEPITDEPPNLDLAQRKPCPKCGSTTRMLPGQIEIKGEGNLTVGKTTVIKTSLKRNWWLILLYVAIEVSGAGIGAFLNGWGSFFFALFIAALTDIIGIYTVVRVVREVTL